MIITMETLYSTIQVREHIHYQVSEITWQCYVRYIAWAQAEYRTVALMFQGGWGVKIDG